MSHFCCRHIFFVENSFISALGPELKFLAWGSYAVELAHCEWEGGVSKSITRTEPMRFTVMPYINSSNTCVGCGGFA